MVSEHHELSHALHRYAGYAHFDPVSFGNGVSPKFISGYLEWQPQGFSDAFYSSNKK
jgi:hypothetical protein